MVKKISDNEIYLLIKYIKSVLWRVAKHLSYIEDAQCLKLNVSNFIYIAHHTFSQTDNPPTDLETSSTGGTCSIPLVQDSTIAGCQLCVGQNHLHIAERKSSVLHAFPVHTSAGGVSFKKMSEQDIISLFQKTSVFESCCEQVQKKK